MSFSAPSQLVARTPHCLGPCPTPGTALRCPTLGTAPRDACFLAVYARYACPVYKQSQTSRRYKLRLSPSLCEHATIPRRLHLSTSLEPYLATSLSGPCSLPPPLAAAPPHPSVPRSPMRNPILDFCSSEANTVGKRPLYRSEAREARAARMPTLHGVPPASPPWHPHHTHPPPHTHRTNAPHD